ncbi:MAG: serine/threonine-protein kinase [Polyangia bacterium]|jgi:eukaryotic-like serine/threonine-protein kinase
MVTVGLPVPRAAQTVRYTFVAPIARGGMGYVELCFRREGRFLHWCARKRLHEQFRSDVRFRSMFMDEARLAGLVRHPNVVGVSDVGEDGDGPYLIMDYVEGVSLSRAIGEMARARRAVPMQVAVRICREVALGLHAAHEVRSEDGTVLHLVHRDVSPQNILIGFDGTVRVTDFGIAKALGNVNQTNTGVLKGNMGYLSPEQLRFEEPDRRSDFFSLGVTLYELLSGARLYSNKDGFDGTRRILAEPPPDIGEIRSDVPAELVELLFEMLSKEREARPSSGLDIATRLEGILAALIAEEGSLTVADHMEQHFALQRQRHRGFLADHLRRLEAQPAASERGTPASLPVVDGPLVPLRARGRFRWLWIGAVSTAAALALLAANRLGARGQAGAPVSAPAPVAAPAAAPPPVDTPAAGAHPSAMAAADPPRTVPAHAQLGLSSSTAAAKKRVATRSGGRSRTSSAHAPRAARAAAPAPTPTFARPADAHAHFAVPLFTQWR